MNKFGLKQAVLAGTEIPGGGERGRPYLTLHWHHRNDSCIKMSSCKSYLIFSLTAQGQSHITVSTEAESNRVISAYQPKVLP